MYFFIKNNRIYLWRRLYAVSEVS